MILTNFLLQFKSKDFESLSILMDIHEPTIFGKMQDHPICFLLGGVRLTNRNFFHRLDTKCLLGNPTWKVQIGRFNVLKGKKILKKFVKLYFLL